jgi:hypothetical protein
MGESALPTPGRKVTEMAYSAKLKRKAGRLGITLPMDGSYEVTEGGWNSGGEDVVFEYNSLLRRLSDGSWTVSLRRSGRKGGYRKVAEVATFDQALALAGFLRKPQNRRAFRGLAPKVQVSA